MKAPPSPASSRAAARRPRRARSPDMASSASPPVDPVWRIELPDEQATFSLAAHLAEWLRPDDLVTLSGAPAPGKTTFARALIRQLTGDSNLEAPSPTFTLMQ